MDIQDTKLGRALYSAGLLRPYAGGSMRYGRLLRGDAGRLCPDGKSRGFA